MKRLVLMSVAAGVALSACARTPQIGDTTAPTISMSEVEQGLPLVASTQPGANVEAMTCSGVGSLQPPFDGYDTAMYHVLAPGQTEVELLISFADVSGIEAARVTFADSSWDVSSPVVTSYQSSHTPGGTLYDYLDWTYEADGELVSPVLQTFELEFDGADPFTGRWIQFRGEDGAGNELASTLLWIVDHDTACS